MQKKKQNWCQNQVLSTFLIIFKNYVMIGCNKSLKNNKIALKTFKVFHRQLFSLQIAPFLIIFHIFWNIMNFMQRKLITKSKSCMIETPLMSPAIELVLVTHPRLPFRTNLTAYLSIFAIAIVERGNIAWDKARRRWKCKLAWNSVEFGYKNSLKIHFIIKLSQKCLKILKK